jgi:hypothetical protein
MLRRVSISICKSERYNHCPSLVNYNNQIDITIIFYLLNLSILRSKLTFRFSEQPRPEVDRRLRVGVTLLPVPLQTSTDPLA